MGLVGAAGSGRGHGAFGGVAAVGAVPNSKFMGGWAVGLGLAEVGDGAVR